ncbi:acyl-CoA dehydrogenase family protein [Streptomyces venetus]|uniref:acyl-CoA dehydrogenase family protein n=1 Tax=Streptomyces venetus TaxID=1701086 RepID=UPI003C3013C8
MDFDLSAAQEKRYAEILRESGSRLGEHRPDGDPDAVRRGFRTAAGIGVTGLCLPEEFGGGGLGALDTALGLEAFGRGCPDTGLAFGIAAHLLACAVPVRDFATDDVRGPLLKGLASGELIAANAMTEDEAGSDIGRLGVTARPVSDGYVLNGEKSWASNAPVAGLVVTYACTAPELGFLGLSAFAVPGDLPGVSFGPPLRKMGLTNCLAGRVTFTDCHVPRRYLLGAEGQGSGIFQHSMAWERAALFGVYLGLMERQLAQCVEHAGHRRQFGRRIGEFQAVSHRTAVMKQRLESGRLLLYRACWLLDEGREDKSAIALAKAAVSEAAVANGLDAMQLFGGLGYLADTGVEEQLRDSLPARVFSGTTEIQREIVAKELGL